MSTENKPAVKPQLPTLAELHHDVAIAFKHDQLNNLLNQPVPKQWVKQNKFANNTSYLPIDKVEFMLTRIFQKWRVEILREGPLFNSVYATVRLHFLDPITGEWDYHDGTGAMPVQTDAGKSASDLAAIKTAAIQMALPGAVSYAIKDAAEHLGTLFGRDLNRKDTINFTGAYSDETINNAAKAIKDARNS
jgi:hypothetical protein